MKRKILACLYYGPKSAIFVLSKSFLQLSLASCFGSQWTTNFTFFFKYSIDPFFFNSQLISRDQIAFFLPFSDPFSPISYCLCIKIERYPLQQQKNDRINCHSMYARSFSCQKISCICITFLIYMIHSVYSKV